MARTLAVVAAWLLLATPAAARFVPVGSPPGSDQYGIQAFAASGDTWLALTNGPVVSRDGGARWQPVPFNGVESAYPSASVSVGPDGAFYVPVDSDDGALLMRLPRDGFAFEPAFRQPPSPNGFRTQLSAPAWDAQKRMWLATSAGSQTAGVERIGADGGVAEQIALGTRGGGAKRIAFIGGRLYADFNTGKTFGLRGGRLEPIEPSTGFVTFVGWPLLAVGRAVLTEAGLSLDAGDSFAVRNTRVDAVEGTDRLLRSVPIGPGEGGRVLERFSKSFFVPTALLAPGETSALWQTARGLVAVGPSGLSLHRGPVPRLTTAVRLPGIARAMIATANRYRRMAGLPPVVGDARISRASRNHAAYWARRGLNFRSLRLNAHSEAPGTKGFTGGSPSERCAHVGAECGGEVINFGNQSQRPVDSWVATPYHRQPFIDPETVVAGAARVGSVAVMNFGGALRGVPLAPVRFPLGRYRGPLVFPGNESPDPIAACRGARQPLGPSPSIPVSFVPPVRTDGFTRVEVFRGRARVPGCTKVGFFMGRSPLRRGTRYTARATWKPSGGGPAVTTVWTFRT